MASLMIIMVEGAWSQRFLLQSYLVLNTAILRLKKCDLGLNYAEK